MLVLFVIITRMTGEPNEFETCFGKGKWAVVCKNDNSKKEIEIKENKLTYNEQIKVVYVDGWALSDKNKKSMLVRDFLTCAKDERKVFILLHPGIAIDIEEAKKIILWCNKNQKILEKNITIAEYSLNDPKIFEEVQRLAKAISTQSDEIDTHISNIRDYILKTQTTPYLIALSILCQGYIAMNIKLGGEITEKELTCESDWWAPVFGESNDFEDTEISNELRVKKKDIKDFKELFNEVKNVTNVDKEKIIDLSEKIFSTLQEL